jgi:hypothetical protein
MSVSMLLSTTAFVGFSQRGDLAEIAGRLGEHRLQLVEALVGCVLAPKPGRMVALYALWYNFVRVHKTFRMSPAMAARIETRLWSMEDIVRLVERREDIRSGAALVG